MEGNIVDSQFPSKDSSPCATEYVNGLITFLLHYRPTFTAEGKDNTKEPVIFAAFLQQPYSCINRDKMKKNVPMTTKTFTPQIKLLTGHRGLPSQAPENTLASLRLAHEKGAHWVEVDIQLTCDYTPIIIHDRKVNRTTNGRGLVCEMTDEHISRLDAGSWYSKDFSGEPIPTLRDTFKLCMELGLTLNLELKVHPGDDVEQLVARVVSVIDQAHFPLDQLVLSSFSVDAIKYCQSFIPKARRGLISNSRKTDFLAMIESCRLFSVHLDYRIARPELVNQLKNAGVLVAIWTMNDASRAEYFYSIGVDNIMSDVIDTFQ